MSWCRSGTLSGQPVRPNAIWSSVLVQVLELVPELVLVQVLVQVLVPCRHRR